MTEVQHERWCRVETHTTAAMKLWETYNMHRLFADNNGVGKWFAVALEDGASDNTLYDTKREAVRFQKHNEKYYTFIRIVPTTMKPCEAEVMIITARRTYKAGMRLADPDDRNGGKDLIKRLTVEDQLNQMRGRNTNLVMPWEN
jgi:hypothetical protein